MKKILTLFVLVFLSFSLFAAPGGGPGGGGRGGSGGPGSRGNPGRNPGSNPGTRPSGGIGPERPGGEPGNLAPPKEPWKNDDFNKDNVTNFRGVRLELSDKEPSVLKTSVSQTFNDKVKVFIYFNQTIKSETITPENIYINGMQLDKSTKIKFNRRADNCSFVISAIKVETIEIKNLEGYNGKKSESVKVEYEKNSDN